MLGNSLKFKLKRQAPRPASPYSVLALKAIPDPRLHIVALDVDDDASIKKSYKEVEKIVGNRGLNVLVNNAGILLPYSTKPGGAIDRPTLMKQFNTNVFGTVVVTQVYIPLLQKAAQRMKGDSFSFSRAAVIHTSSIIGSIFNNRGSEGEFAAYMGSKTAVNQFSRTFAFDLAPDRILSVAFHPGFVSTDMTGHSKEAIAALKAISDPRLHIVALDVDDDASIRESYKEVEKIVGDNGLNVLVNNAGILLSYSVKPDGKIDRSILMKQFNTNVFGTVVVTQVYTPLLQKAAAHKKDDSFSFGRAAVIQVSSYMGSIALNSWGSGARGIFMSAYRGSKAALNQFSRTFSHDFKPYHILSVAIHPGSVQTDMAGPRAALTAEQSARSLVNSFYKLNRSHNGNFYKEDLTPLPF